MVDLEFYVIKFIGLALILITGYKLITTELRGLRRRSRPRR